jgi:hypothetical protein
VPVADNPVFAGCPVLPNCVDLINCDIKNQTKLNAVLKYVVVDAVLKDETNRGA